MYLSRCSHLAQLLKNPVALRESGESTHDATCDEDEEKGKGEDGEGEEER
jgi:hypothetical protein